MWASAVDDPVLSLLGRQSPDGEQQADTGVNSQPPPGPGFVHGPKVVNINAAGNHGDPGCICSIIMHQIGLFTPTGCQQPLTVLYQFPFNRQTPGGFGGPDTGVGFHGPQGVKGDHMGPQPSRPGHAPHMAGDPVVAVDQIIGAILAAAKRLDGCHGVAGAGIQFGFGQWTAWGSVERHQAHIGSQVQTLPVRFRAGDG